MKYDIIIYGCGHTGSCIGAMLSKLPGLRLLVIDIPPYTNRQSKNNPKRLFAISKGSILTLRNAIDYKKLLSIGQPINHIKVIEENSSHFLDFSPSEINEENFGLMIHEHKLHELMKDSITNIEKECAYITSVSQDEKHVTIKLSSGKTAQASLLISADGKHSQIRNQLDFSIFKHDYRQEALVCEVEHEFDHNGLAVEKFLPSGPFAILPRKGRHKSSIVWSIDEHLKTAFIDLPIKMQHQLIKDHFPDFYGNIIIKSNIQFFHLNLHIAHNPSKGRVLLLGDAAHAMHPLAGQGFNLTVRDIKLLARIISETYNLGGDLGSPIILKQYTKNRMLDTNLLIESTHLLNSLFSNHSKTMKIFRGLGMSLVNRTEFLKKYCMLYALSGMDF